MKTHHDNDSLNAERIRMENLGRVFIIILFASLVVVGHFLFGY